jgi:hypothetical protein
MESDPEKAQAYLDLAEHCRLNAEVRPPPGDSA